MLTIVEVEEEKLEKMETEGGLKKETLRKRELAYKHFAEFIKDETDSDLEDLLKSEEQITVFTKAFGRLD